MSSFFLLALLSQLSLANMNTLTAKALYKSKDGHNVVVNYQGKTFHIKDSQIKDLTKAITGQEVTVIFYPKDLGIID